MKKRMMLPIAAVALVGLMTAFATTAQAYSDKTTLCSGCHSGSNIVVTATLASTTGTNATYNYSAVGANTVAIFDGSTCVFTGLASSGQFVVATGKTYTIQAVAGPGTSDGIGSTTVSPVVAPVLDTTAPVTTSDAKATYVSSAAIKLTTTDAGSGVASTYYTIDGGLQASGTAINLTTVGAHTITFWSVDVAGNIESVKTASFTITEPVVVLDTTAPVTTSDAKTTYVSSAAITLTATDAGSGVASTYYKIDGGLQATGTAINVTALGAHTVEYWSVDVAGNVELSTTVSFTITEPVIPDPTTELYTVKAHVPSHKTLGHVSTLTNKATGATFTAIVGEHGVVVFTDVPAGTYRLSVTTDKGEKSLRTIHVQAPEVDDDDHDVKHDEKDDEKDNDSNHHTTRSHQVRGD